MSAIVRISQTRLRCRDFLSRNYVHGVQCAAISQYLHGTKPKLEDQVEDKIDPEVLKFREKLIFCDHLDSDKVKTNFLTHMLKNKKQDEIRRREATKKMMNSHIFSTLALKRVNNSVDAEEQFPDEAENRTDPAVESKPIQMPYGQVHEIERSVHTEKPNSFTLNQKYKDMYEEYQKQQELLVKNAINSNDEDNKNTESKSSWIRPKDDLSKVPPNWMTDFEQFDDTQIDKVQEYMYGTSDVSAKVSDISCGGCGALLHCRDPAFPGYLPSELLLPATKQELKIMTCQRCHFLKHYNTALDVQVSPDEYLELLKAIKQKKCAVILVIDLTDFPCSIWPSIADVLHPLTPVFLVGNKVDVLPPDSENFLTEVKKYLFDYVQQYTNIRPEMIVHTELISAKTGYGVESLITSLQHKWRHKGDIYLIGCTNVGKSSLFNALLQSDYCKVQAVDLVQRATISAWPGTTLNLLKFPILNPTTQKIARRLERLKQTNETEQADMKYKRTMFQRTRQLKFASLTGIIDYTFYREALRRTEVDPFSEKSYKACPSKFGLDETRPEYSQSRWCYDTPGTVHHDQVIDLLTTDELFLTLSNKMISPRTFRLYPKQTVFLAGLGRLDFLEGNKYIRCTLFASRHLPLTICQTSDADLLYTNLLKTKAFTVPTNDSNRLAVWPGLGSKDFVVFGSSYFESVADVVLSSIGWIAITAEIQEKVALRAWTPQGRGLFLRKPALLKNIINLHGKRIPGTPLYRKGKHIYCE